MSNEFYNPSGSPSTGSSGSSAVMRSEFTAIQAGFALLPTMFGNGSLPLFVNAGATALEAVSSSTARARLSLGTMSAQNANNVAITGGSITGVTGVVTTAALAASSGSSLAGFIQSGSGLAATDVQSQLRKAEFFESISALKAWSGPTDKTVAFVRGYYAAGDFGGGLYYYDSSSTGTDNGGTIINPTAAPATGRWLRQYDARHYSIKVFGAIGDGSTDDTAAIVAAVAALPNGGTLFVPKGAYKVTSQIDLSAKTSICIEGEGIDNTPSLASTKGSSIVGSVTGADILKYVGAGTGNSIVIRKLGVANTSATGQSAIHIENVTIGHVVDVGVASSGTYGIYAPSNTFTIGFEHIKFNGVGNTGIGLYTGGHCHISNCDVVGWDEGIRASGSTVNIVGCRLEVNKTAALMLGKDSTGSTVALQRSFIAGNSYEANDTDIVLNSVSASTFLGSAMQGSVGSPAGQSKVGIDVLVVTDVTMFGITPGGTYSTAAFRIRTGGGKMTLINCTAANTHATGKKWDVQHGLTNLEFINCDYLIRPDDTVARQSLRRHGMLQYLSQIDYLNPNVEGKNLRGKGVAVAGAAASAAITFTAGGHGAGNAAINTATATAGAGLADGTYFYIATAVTQHGECAGTAEKTVTMSAGNNQGTITFFGMTADGFKRRVYRGTATGVYDGYYERALNSSANFVDTGAAFDGKKSPPAAGIDDTDMREPDANYVVLVDTDWTTSYSITGKATTGFTVNFGTAAPGGGGTMSWVLVR